MLGDIAGLRVLDAACGPGRYAESLVERGSDVVGFDQSPCMIELAGERVPRGTFRVHDLARPLDWIDSGSMDRVLFALAIEYVDDRVAALSELRRVLRPSGALVLSRQHPTADWLKHGGNYFEPRVINETWSRGRNVRYWRAQSSGPGAVLSFEIDGTGHGAEAVCNRTRLIVHATSLGGVETLIERRARYLSEVAAGTPAALLRLSVGIEDVDDLWHDLEQALDPRT